MADHWVFDKATNINGSAVSGLTLNSKGFDELYYDGTHIAHFAKDVSVSINRGCFRYIDRYSKTFENYRNRQVHFFRHGKSTAPRFLPLRL